MKVFRFNTLEVIGDEVSCPGCNYKTSVVFTIARTEKEAEKLLETMEVDFLCGSCFSSYLADYNWIVNNKFDPDDYPHLIFIQWLDKEDVEWYLGEKVTDEEFQELKDRLENDMVIDHCTESIADGIRIIYEEMKDEMKD